VNIPLATSRMDIEGVVCKWCPHLKHWVDETLFHRNKNTKDGLSYMCKGCKKLTTDSPQAKKHRHLRNRYGIGLGEYESMVEEQSGRCPICENVLPSNTKNIHIDHCHDSNEVRGILCVSCNIMLGHAKDDINTLLNAIDYLREHDSRIKEKLRIGA
jgi:hypothetical protein